MTNLDFESLERQVSRKNLLDVEREVRERSPRLRRRILHFSRQFDIPEERYWRALEADPSGPLASNIGAGSETSEYP